MSLPSRYNICVPRDDVLQGIITESDFAADLFRKGTLPRPVAVAKDSMSLLKDCTWQCKYSPEDGNLLHKFYIPALACAERYDRSTGYFSAEALDAAAHGVEGLVRNGGRMRLLVGCTLDQEEVEAVRRGESLRDTLNAHMLRMPLKLMQPAAVPEAPHCMEEALELLVWMVARSYLEVRVALPCDEEKRPVNSEAIFHEKAGIIEDKTGDRLAFNGSINERLYGWTQNWDSFHVFTSWTGSAEHVDEEDRSFQRLWGNRMSRALVVDMPTALRDNLLRFLPKEEPLPRRLKNVPMPEPTSLLEAAAQAPTPELFESPQEARAKAWEFIARAPSLPDGGERVGEATCIVTPWPHQVRSFHRMYDQWPPRLLIADEVGLGKTIQAGLLLRQAWLSGRAKRILVLAPKSVLRQWQLELREKFNLNWPIYDGQKFSWAPSHMYPKGLEKAAGSAWHEQPFVLASSHLMRRRDRADELLHQAAPWDIVVLDEAHHARRKGGGLSSGDDRPNQLLRLMQELAQKTPGLILLTATPMQVSPLEVWDLLNLLGLPHEWSTRNFLNFFDLAAHPCPDTGQIARMAEMFRACEARYGEVSEAEAQRFAPEKDSFTAGVLLKALRAASSLRLQKLESDCRKAAVALMKAHSPLKKLISRHTRELLRRYHKAGKLSTRIATRLVEDRLIDMTPDERTVYDAVEAYISTTYNNAAREKRTAIGFVMTIYRRRLASSFFALAQTLQNRMGNVAACTQGNLLDEDIFDDELAGETMDAEDAAELESRVQEEKADIASLLVQARRLPVDSKAKALLEAIEQQRNDGFRQVIIFTQYTDTLDFLRGEVARTYGGQAVLCFSGRGGEVYGRDGAWQVISREDTKKRFKERQAEIMLCSDAVAEGLNFQFCGALINYDMPWNPMRVEQRIGRIDRLGQEFEHIRIINLHYANTVEADVYCALRERISLFTKFVGKLQPILARLPKTLAEVALANKVERQRGEAELLSSLAHDVQELEASGFDLDDSTDEELTELARAPARYDLPHLQAMLTNPALLPIGVEVAPITDKDFSYIAPGMTAHVRVTTDAEFYEAHPESVELWSPGSPAFPHVRWGEGESTQPALPKNLKI